MADRLNRPNLRIDIGNSLSSVHVPSSLLSSMIEEYRRDDKNDKRDFLPTKKEKNKTRKLSKGEMLFIENMAAIISRD